MPNVLARHRPRTAAATATLATATLATVALSTVAALLAGCTDDGTPKAATSPATDGAGAGGTGQAPEPIDVCAQTTGTCAHVADADIDGDGQADQIGVAYGPGVEVIVGSNGAAHRLQVTTETSGIGYTEPAEIYRGAFLLTRPTGADIALHLVRGGGGSERFAVVTWDGSALQRVPQPPSASRPMTGDPDIWYLGSSHGVLDFVICRAPGEIAMARLTAGVREGIEVPGGARRTDEYFTFGDGHWTAAGSGSVQDPSHSYSWDAHTGAFQCEDQGTPP